MTYDLQDLPQGLPADVRAGIDATDPFELWEREAARLDRYFAGLSAAERGQPSRCAGWSRRDVLAHLAGEEIYNHACLDDDIPGTLERLRTQGFSGALSDFNAWCVGQRAGRAYEDVLEEWRTRSAESRTRMRALGRTARLATVAGPYPVALQALHYASEYATHADDAGVPVEDHERVARTAWRVLVGRFVLAEQGRPVSVSLRDSEGSEEAGVEVVIEGHRYGMPASFFVEATVRRLPDGFALGAVLHEALGCLA